MMKIQSAALLLLFSLLSACSDSGEAAEPQGRNEDSSAGTVALGIRELTYRPMAVGTAANISGSITTQAATPDSTVAVTRDQGICGDSATVTSSSASGVLVWVDGITSGKPLPGVRREKLTIQRCRFEPRVLAVVKGTTINVSSQDRAMMTSRFYREGAGKPVDEIWTVDAGQVVPSEKIASAPGIVEVRSVQQPWTRGYVAVFDHPYFAVADERGAFTIDSLPPGTYTVKVWHERLEKPTEQRVVVSATGSGRLDLSLTLQ
ncbi:MAG TPA: carboxypeptidase-like regulatory domain-containing protein [Gemmatimonadaceae bacterium]|nr:carboxypeptidase-like regulatory domain-containing protein [Gemmatimonadaceae bacterium]